MNTLRFICAGVVLSVSVVAWHGCAVEPQPVPAQPCSQDPLPPSRKPDPSDDPAVTALTEWQKRVIKRNGKRQQGFLSFEAPLQVAFYVILKSQLRPIASNEDSLERVSYRLKQREIELLSDSDISVKGILFHSEELGKRSIALKQDIGKQSALRKDNILVKYPAFVGYVCDDAQWSQGENRSPDGGHVIDASTYWCTPYPGSPPASLSLLNLERLAPFASSSIASQPVSILAHNDDLSVMFDISPGWEMSETHLLAYLAFWRVGSVVGISTSWRVARPMMVTSGAQFYVDKFELTCTAVSEKAVSFKVRFRRG